VQDARRHKVEVLPVDVMTSEVDCTLENMSNDVETVTNTPTIAPTNGKIPRQAALRLGLRMIRSLSKSGAERLVQARRRQSFSSIHDLSTRAALHKNDLEALAAAGALESLSGHRYRARWEVMGLLKDTPLLQGPIQEALPLLLSPSEGQNIVADYHTTGLTLGRHPLALLRENLRQLRVCRSDDIRRMPHGRHVHIAGIVTARQRPGTATGVTFLTLEDEAGVFNVIVWRDIAERQRKELLNSRLLGVYGEVQREGEVIHIIARYLRDYSRSLGQLNTHSRDFH
jgi:error-prone DNA polymerase